MGRDGAREHMVIVSIAADRSLQRLRFEPQRTRQIPAMHVVCGQATLRQRLRDRGLTEDAFQLG